jgi:hypothetical protein
MTSLPAASQEDFQLPLEKDSTSNPEPILHVKSHEEWIQPKQPDTLFWCLYIAHHGHAEYLQIDRNYGVCEMNIKKAIGEFVTEHPHKFKETNQKITKVAIQEIRSECLTSDKTTSMNCVLAMAIYYRFHVLLVEENDKFFLNYRINDDTETPTYVCKRNSFGKYSVLATPLTSLAVEEWKSSRFELIHHLKPMKAIGAYHVEELEALAKQIGLLGEENKKRKKGEIYEAIKEVMKWY